MAARTTRRITKISRRTVRVEVTPPVRPTRRRRTGNASIARAVDDMVHPAKGTVAGAGGFSTNPGSQRPILGTLAGLDPEARRVEKVVRKRRVKVEEVAPKRRARRK
jgi:hypothetical protein